MVDSFKAKLYKLIFATKSDRPRLPPLLITSFVIWALSASVYNFCNFDKKICIFIFICLFALIIFGIITYLLYQNAIISLLIIAFALGVAIGMFGIFDMDAKYQKIENGIDIRKIVLQSDVEKTDIGGKANVVGFTKDNEKYKLVCYFKQEERLLCGTTILTSVRVKQLNEQSKIFYKTSGIVGSINVNSYKRDKSNLVLNYLINFREQAIKFFEKHGTEQGKLLQALVCGYRPNIKDSGIYDNFKVCGLAHIVAVSGAHLAIVVALILLILGKLKLKRVTIAIITIVFILFYLIFAGIPISAIRAAIMVCLSCLSGIFTRRSSTLNSLGFVIILFLVSDYSTCVSVSFFLSASATLGIIVFASLVQGWFCIKNSKIDDFIIQPTSLTLSSNILTLPASASLFSQISLIGLLSNIVATPLFTLGCLMGLTGAIFNSLMPYFGDVLLYICEVSVTPLLVSVKLMAQIPYACIPISLDIVPMLVLSIILFIGLYVWWPKFNIENIENNIKGNIVSNIKRIGIVFGIGCCAISIFIFVLPLFNDIEIVILDVGQGDSILIKSNNRAVLVDTGNQKSKLKEGLAKERIYKLDAVVITHHDDDHMGCLDDMKNYLQVDNVYTSAFIYRCDCKNCGNLKNLVSKSYKKDIIGLNVGDKFTIGKFSCEVVWPEKFNDEGGNEDSVVMLVKSDIDGNGKEEVSVLLTGDAEKESIQKIIDEGRVGDIDVLKVGHHGSKVSTDEKVLNVIKPEVSVISVGANNRYGHPKDETIQNLKNANAKIFRTDEMGYIRIIPSVNSYSVKAEKQ